MAWTIHFRCRNQAIKVKTQLIVQALLNRAAKQTGEDEPSGNQAEHAPHRGPGDQPKGQRIGIWKESPQLCSSAALGSSSR